MLPHLYDGILNIIYLELFCRGDLLVLIIQLLTYTVSLKTCGCLFYTLDYNLIILFNISDCLALSIGSPFSWKPTETAPLIYPHQFVSMCVSVSNSLLYDDTIRCSRLILNILCTENQPFQAVLVTFHGEW